MNKIDKIKNWYEELPSKMKTAVKPDKNFNKHLVSPESMILLIGPTGSGKSNWILEFLDRKVNAFFDIIIFSGSFTDEPMYNYLKSKIKDLQLIDDLDLMPTLDDLKEIDRKERLLIFDDSINLPRNKMDEIKKVFMSARKKGFTVIFVSQKFTTIPIFIREQVNYIILFKIPDDDAVKIILRRYKMDFKNQDELLNRYRQITNIKGQFITFDLKLNQIRHNFIQRL